MFNWLYDPQAWIALATLTSLEIVLGIDNIIFISILVAKLPVEQRNRGRIMGLALAMLARIGPKVAELYLSGKLELEGNVSYTFRDAFVNGGVMLRYNPAGSFVIYTGLDYLRRDGFAVLGAGVRF